MPYVYPSGHGIATAFLAGCVLKSLICRNNDGKNNKNHYILSVFKHCCLPDSRKGGELCGAVTGSCCKKGQY